MCILQGSWKGEQLIIVYYNLLVVILLFLKIFMSLTNKHVILEELALSGHEKYHKTWKDDFEKIVKQFILPEVPCYLLYRYIFVFI